jgi:hypothetical protein
MRLSTCEEVFLLLMTRETKHKLIGALIYGVAAAGTANWVIYALDPDQPYGYPGLLYVALVGSVALGIGSILSTFSRPYGVIAGSVGAGISWIYFAPFSWFLPWRRFRWVFSIDLPWIVTNHVVDLYPVVAILLLVVATAYSISKRRLWWRFPKGDS